jgi:hypothetical protein
VSARPLDLTVFAATPPIGWTDLGWIENLKRSDGTRIATVRTGTKGVALTQFRSETEACVQCDFLEWGKLQMALSSGGQPINVLAAGDAVALSSQSTRAELLLDAEGTPFVTGDVLAVDVDYSGQPGPAGTGIAGAYVRSGADVQSDVDFVRRVTLNVARVATVDGAALTLQQPLPFAVPTGAKAQRVIAFADCEGAGFFAEWSALFVVESETGGRVCYYYPRLQPAASAQESSIEIEAPLETVGLHAAFRAMPAEGNSMLCYRLHFPATNAPAY